MGCPYATALGVPGEGIHATRIFGLSLYDIVFTIIVAFLFSYLFGYSFWNVLLFLLVLGEVLHYAFGTQTAFLTMIGIKMECN
jgi:hypothetical protein